MDKKLEDLLRHFNLAQAVQVTFENRLHEFIGEARKITSNADEKLAHFDEITPFYASHEEVVKMLLSISEIKREASAALMPDSTYASIVRRIEKEYALYHLGSGVPYTRSILEETIKKEGLEVRHDLLMQHTSFRLDQSRNVKKVQSGSETYYGVEATRDANFVYSKIRSLAVEHNHKTSNPLPFSFTAADIDIINQESVKTELEISADYNGLLKAHDANKSEPRYYFRKDFPNTYHGNFINGENNGLGREQVHRTRKRLAAEGNLREGEHFIFAEGLRRPYFAYSNECMELIKRQLIKANICPILVRPSPEILPIKIINYK